MMFVDDLNPDRNKLYRVKGAFEQPFKSYTSLVEYVPSDDDIMSSVIGKIYSISGEGNWINEIVIKSQRTGELYRVTPYDIEIAE